MYVAVRLSLQPTPYMYCPTRLDVVDQGIANYCTHLGRANFVISLTTVGILSEYVFYLTGPCRLDLISLIIGARGYPLALRAADRL